MIPPTYYRSLLFPAGQELYRQIVCGLLDRQEQIALDHSLLPAQVQSVVQAVHLDHPELFFVDFWKYHLRTAFPSQRTLVFRLMLDPTTSAAVRRTMDARAAALADICRRCTTREQTYFRIAEEIAASTRYRNSGSAFWDHTAAGPTLRHSAVCEGVAKLFLFLCQRQALDCAVITGSVRGIPHAWNMVEVNGTRTYLDVTALLQRIEFYRLWPRAIFLSLPQLQRQGYCPDFPQDSRGGPGGG